MPSADKLGASTLTSSTYLPNAPIPLRTWLLSAGDWARKPRPVLDIAHRNQNSQLNFVVYGLKTEKTHGKSKKSCVLLHFFKCWSFLVKLLK